MKNKLLNILITILFSSFFFGCGHSIVRTDRGAGFHLRVPNPFHQGDSIVDVKLGNIDTTIAIIRGNTTFDSNSAKGGTFTGIGGISERFAISSNPQLNEGYIVDVLTSPNLSDEVKFEIAKYLSSSKAPQVSDSKSVTIGAASGSGKNASEIKPEKTGLDNFVDKTVDAIVKTSPVVTQTTQSTINDRLNLSNHASNESKQTIDESSKTTSNLTSLISDHILLSIIIAIIFIVILIFLIEWIFKKNKHKKDDEDIDE